MPSGNGTGPAGAGPMTGRGAGFCAGYTAPGYTNPGFTGGFGMGLGRGGRMGRGRGFGRGFGLGFGRGFGWTGAAGQYPQSQNLTADQEIEALKGQASYFKDSLKQVNQQIEELQKRDK